MNNTASPGDQQASQEISPDHVLLEQLSLHEQREGPLYQATTLQRAMRWLSHGLTIVFVRGIVLPMIVTVLGITLPEFKTSFIHLFYHPFLVMPFMLLTGLLKISLTQPQYVRVGEAIP